MAAVVDVLASSAISTSISTSGAPASAPATEVQHAASQSRPSGASGDVVYVSRASTLLSQIEQQLRKTPATAVNQVLSSAATDIFAQAQVENDPNQAKVLENLATRLQVVANSGPSGLPPYSLVSLLWG
jgi:hypothetical protein